MTPHTTPGKAPLSRLEFYAPITVGYAIALLVFVADVLTKYLVHEFTPYGWSWPVTGFFNLVHVWNQGAAFSFLADAGGWQRLFFIAVAAVVSVWLIATLRKPMRFVEQLALSLILGGALGNGLDRGMRGYVVDFLDFYWRGWHWPAFNIADIGIVCGAALVLLTSFKTRPAPKPADAAS
ncbi:MAG: signal peptidase II [Pseudomonadota bacterium]